MRLVFRQLRPGDPTSSRRLKTAYALVAVCLLIIDVSLVIIPGGEFNGALTVAVTLAILASIVFSGWNVRFGGILVAVFSLIGILAPQEYASIGISAHAIHIVCADWIARKWIGESIIAMFLVDAAILLTISSEDASSMTALLTIAWAASFISGLLFNRARHERQHLARKVTDLEDEFRRTRHDLSVRLHDSAAAELTKVILLSEELTQSTVDAGVRAQSEAITCHGRTALATIRDIIRFNTPQQSTPPSLSSTIAAFTRLLDSRGVALSVDMPENADAALSYPSRDFLCLAIREGCLNICKYAPRDSTAFLTIEQLDDDAVDCTLSNIVGSSHHRSAHADPMSGGFGLRSLHESAELIGADIRYGQSGSRWFLTVSIPGYSTGAAPSLRLSDTPSTLDGLQMTRGDS